MPDTALSKLMFSVFVTWNPTRMQESWAKALSQIDQLAESCFFPPSQTPFTPPSSPHFLYIKFAQSTLQQAWRDLFREGIAWGSAGTRAPLGLQLRGERAWMGVIGLLVFEGDQRWAGAGALQRGRAICA